MNSYLFHGLENAICALIGILMGILYIGFPCLVFIYLAGAWTSLSVYYFIKYAESRRTEITTREQSDA